MFTLSPVHFMYCAVEALEGLSSEELFDELVCGLLDEDELEEGGEEESKEESCEESSIKLLSNSSTLSLICVLVSSLEEWFFVSHPISRAVGANKQIAKISAAIDLFFFIIFSPF